MTQEVKRALLLHLIQTLRKMGSWCGETHLQKATYFLQEMLGVDAEFCFIFYRHGPYSFDLHDELAIMQMAGLAELRIADARYGPRYDATALGRELVEQQSESLNSYTRAVEFVSGQLGGKGVVDLERLATAYYVRRNPSSDEDDWASRISKLKPHITEDKAAAATSAIEEMEAQLSFYQVSH